MTRRSPSREFGPLAFHRTSKSGVSSLRLRPRAKPSSPPCCRIPILAERWPRHSRRRREAAGLQPPNIRMHAAGMASITAAARDLSDYANRRGPIDAKIKAARALGTAEGRREAQELAKDAHPAAVIRRPASRGHRRRVARDCRHLALLRCGSIGGADHRPSPVG